METERGRDPEEPEAPEPKEPPQTSLAQLILDHLDKALDIGKVEGWTVATQAEIQAARDLVLPLTNPKLDSDNGDL